MHWVLKVDHAKLRKNTEDEESSVEQLICQEIEGWCGASGVTVCDDPEADPARPGIFIVPIDVDFSTLADEFGADPDESDEEDLMAAVAGWLRSSGISHVALQDG